MGRWIRFFFAILFGVGLGLAYGWFLNPAAGVETSLDALRIDYKTDFVLMVAESYQNEGDMSLAARRLALLGDSSQEAHITQAIEFALKAGYTEPDISRMQALLSAIQTQPPAQGNSAQ